MLPARAKQIHWLGENFARNAEFASALAPDRYSFIAFLPPLHRITSFESLRIHALSPRP
jgi:hypothetical protein